MAVGVNRFVRKAASEFDQDPLSRPVSEAMSNGLASMTSVGMIVSDQPHSLSGTTNNVDPTASPSFQQQSIKRRRPSKTKELRRPSSTPHMRNLALSTSAELSPTTDKRRNKLGYHRTSVACVHCRRRKIRCLVASDDVQGRCSNCIRLKKDCKFFPVEQQPDNNARSQSGLMKDNILAGSSAATLPARYGPTAPGERVDDFRNPTFAVSASHGQRFGMQNEVDIDPQHSPMSGGGVQLPRSPYPYPPPIETQWHTPGFLPSSTVAENSPSSAGFWRPSPSASNSAYGSESNASVAPGPASISSSSNMSYNHNWAPPNMGPPARSMSYGNIEVPHQYPNAGLGIQQQDYSRRTSSYPYPTIDTAPTIHTTTLGTPAAPLSAPILPNQSYGYPPWHQFGGVHHGAQEMHSRHSSTQWNAEPARLGRVHEDHPPAPILYSQHSAVPCYYSGS